MSVQTILEAFQRAVAAGQLRGNDPDGLIDLLRRLHVDDLTVSGGQPGSDATSAWLAGTTTYLGSSWVLRLIGTPVEGTERATLVLELTLIDGSTPWTFRAAFGSLRPSRRQRTGPDGQPIRSSGLILGDSVIAPLVLEGVSITATNAPPPGPLPRVAGTLPLLGRLPGAPGSDLLKGYAGYLGDTLYVDGTFDLSGTEPVLDLRAVSPGAQLSLGRDLGITAIGIQLITTYPDPASVPAPGAPLSAVLLFAEVSLPAGSAEPVVISGPLLSGDFVWPVKAAFGTGLPMEGGIQALLAIVGADAAASSFTLPPGLAPINAFGLSDVGFGVTPVTSGLPGLSYVSVGITSARPWDPPIPYLTMKDVGTRWAFYFRENRKPLVVGTVFGTMQFGAKTGSSLGAMAPHLTRVDRGLVPPTGLDGVSLTVQLALPELAFSVVLDQPIDIPIDEAFRTFFGPDLPATTFAHLQVTSLSVYATLLRKDFEAGLTVSGDLPFPIGTTTLSLTALQLQVNVTQKRVAGKLVGKAEIAVPESGPPIELVAQASYPGTGAWEFALYMRGEVDLPRLVYGLIGSKPPPWVDQIAIVLADLEVRYSTADGNPFTAAGTLKAKFGEKLLGVEVSLLLAVRVQRALRSPSNEHLAVALRDTALVAGETVLTGSVTGSFAVGPFVVSASVSVTDADKDYTFAVKYRELSLSAATSWIVSPPNTERHQVVTIRLTGTVGDLVTYLVALVNPNADFRLDPPWDFLDRIDLSGLALVVDPTLQSVAVTYDIKLDLGFVTIDSIGLRYVRSNGNPTVEFVLSAKMLGDQAAKPVVWDAINQSPPPVPGAGSQLLDLRYVGLGQHISPKGLTEYKDIAAVVDGLVAAMRPVNAATGKPPIDPATIEFDPSNQWLFGVDAKVMDTVSLKLVFHDPDLYGLLVSLSGPSAASLAGLSIELLYKKVTDDIGVFHARFQIPDAFRQLQFGAVSVTLGVVTVDIFTNGNFKVDLGFPHNRDWSVSFALEAGIFNGRGGIYFGLLNGATSSRVPKITNGNFSPVIELGIGLSVGVGRTFEKGPLEAGLYVNLVVVFEGALAWFHPDDGNAGTEMYYWCRGTAGIVGKLYGSVDFKIIAVEVNLEISATATLELEAHKKTIVELDVTMRASASVKIVFFKVSFSFSLSVRTSFVIGSDSTAPWSEVRGTAPRPRLTSAASLGAAPDGYRLDFDKDAKVFPDGRPHTAYLSLVPAFTIAGVPVNWTGDGVVPPNPSPAYRLVVMLVTDNPTPVGARTIAETHRPDVSRLAHAETAADTSFNQLAEGLFRWSVNAFGITSPTATVTLADLVALVAQLALPEAADTGFTWPNLEGFFTNNLHVVVSGTPTGSLKGFDLSGTPFPMIPALRWTSPDLPDPTQRDRDFTTYQMVDSTYEAGALAYFAKLDPRPPGDRPSVAEPLLPVDPVESMTTFVLRDYARLIARAATQAAVDLLTSYPHPVVASDTLRSIEKDYGVDLVDVALANPDWPVAAGAKASLGSLPVQVAAGTTIDAVAKAYGADVNALLTELDAVTPLLRPGATMPLPGFRHAGLSVVDTAAVFFVRLGMTRPEDVVLADWYQAAIERLNPTEVLPDPLVVPTGYQQTATTTWTLLAGDTILDVAAYLALAQNADGHPRFATWLAAVREANPTPGADVALPADAAAVILEHDTLAGLRDRLLLDAAPFAGYLTVADVLVPLVTVDVPGASITTAPDLTLLTLAQSYDLSLEDLAGRIADDAGVLATTETTEKSLRIPDVPELTLEKLTTAMHDGEPMATVAGQVARFMLNGLRLPAPEHGEDGKYHATGPMTGVYELTGQQVTGPAPAPQPAPPPAGEPDAPPVVTITVDKGQAADWLTFAPAVVRDAVLTFGDETGQADVVITEADLEQNYPATGLAPEVIQPLAPLALSHDVGVRYGVPQMIPWQTTVGPVLPDAPPAGATPSLWPLPADLLGLSGGGASTSPFVLEQTTPQTGAGAPFTELGAWAWGTLVAFGVRRIPGLAGTVEVFGADTADRQRLADVLDHLRRTATGAEVAHLRLLWQLPPTPGMRPGLTSIALDPATTFIVQTNLTTETRRGVGAGPAPIVHSATIAEAGRFLTLLWECSVVGGGGYWMRLGSGGADVPDSIFDQDGLASLSLLVQLGSQSTNPPERHLFGFNNVAVVGDGIDPASVALSARAVDPPQLAPVASVDPGQVGFAGEYANPGNDETPQGVLRRLYGLLGYELVKTAAFDASREGRPVGPKPPDSHDDLGVAVCLEDDEKVWQLARVVDISRYALQPPPAVPTAPSPDQDPYAGIAAGAATAASLWFQDVFGNVSGTPTPVPIPVRYTDPLLGPGSWPSTTTRFTVQAVPSSGAGADVVVEVDLQTVAYQPSAADPAHVAAAAAGRDRQRLAKVWYQVSQPDVHAGLRTSLHQAADADPIALPVDIEELRRYVLGGHALLGSIASLANARASGGTIDELVRAHGLDHDTLAAANADAVLVTLLDATSLQVPVSAAFRNGDTVAGLCRTVQPPADPTTVLEDQDNIVLPLTIGVEVRTPTGHLDVGHDEPAAADLAVEARCSLAGLVAANATTPGLLTPGFIFDCNGVKVGVAKDLPAADTTLALVAQTFQHLGLPYDAVTVVALNREVPGMFRAGAPLAVDSYVVVSGDTLEHNQAGRSPADLAPGNADTPDLFPPGTPLFLTTRTVPVPAATTLAEFAAAHGTTPGALLRHNGSVTVSTTTPPAIPGTWAWPTDPTALVVPYTVQAGDTLAAVATHFDGADARSLVAANAAMPATVAAGVTVTIGADHVTTSVPSSFDTVRGLFPSPVTLDALADAIAARNDVLASGALLVCPRGILTAGPVAAEGVVPGAAARPFGVSAVALLAANAGTPGMLLAGQKLLPWVPRPAPIGRPSTSPTSLPPEETIASDDTLTAIVERFRRQGVVTSIETLVAANASVPFLRVGAFVLVPPATARLSARLGGAPWTFPAAVFPLTVTLELARDPNAVDPDLAGTATCDRTAIPAARPADDTEGGGRSLAAFADALQAAVPDLRVATGKVAGAETDVWAVVLGPTGIASVSITAPVEIDQTAQPRTFAIRPLANALVAREKVFTKELNVATGELSGGASRNYQGIDLEIWARTLLTDVELLLSAPYARGAFALNRDALDAIVQAKKTLAAAVAAGLDYVLVGEAPAAPPDLKRAAAVETLRQQLLVSLVRGYDTSAVIQYDTAVVSPWSTTYARLAGNPAVTFGDADLRTATVSNGKVSLENGTSEVSFLVNVPDVQAHAGIDLTLDFDVVELEFAIETGADGYERSDWLTFVSPLDDAAVLHLDLGSARVPLPLRAYPPMPILVGHEAVVPIEPTVLDDALHWQYELAVQHQSAEQDAVGLRLTYNLGAPAVALASPLDDLFDALAQYAAVATPLLGLLAGIVDPESQPVPDPTVLATALTTFATLVTNVGTAWQGRWSSAPTSPAAPPPRTIGPPMHEYRFALGLQHAGDWYTGLRLTPVGTTGAGWPDICCVTPDGVEHELTHVADGAYTFVPGTVAAFSLLTFRFRFPPVHVASYQDATSATWVTRNAHLLGNGWPTTWPATMPDFVYRTPEVSYPKPVVPFIDVTNSIDIEPWSPGTLAAVFDAVFDHQPNGRTIAVGVRYGYTLVPGEQPVEALLPVVQSTVGDYGGGTIAAITQRLDTWLSDIDPVRPGGAWAFWVSLYSSLDPTLQRPVLQLKRLSSPLG